MPPQPLPLYSEDVTMPTYVERGHCSCIVDGAARCIHFHIFFHITCTSQCISLVYLHRQGSSVCSVEDDTACDFSEEGGTRKVLHLKNFGRTV